MEIIKCLNELDAILIYNNYIRPYMIFWPNAIGIQQFIRFKSWSHLKYIWNNRQTSYQLQQEYKHNRLTSGELLSNDRQAL